RRAGRPATSGGLLAVGVSAAVVAVYPLEQVAGLAVQDPAHCVQSIEADRLGPAVLQHRYVGRSDPDPLRELDHAHLALDQLHVDAHHDRHQITPSISVRRVVACRSRSRITTISNTSTAPISVMPISATGIPDS